MQTRMNPRAGLRLAVPGTLTIGVDESPPPPFCFGLPGRSDFYGFEVDLTLELATRLGLEASYASELWSRILDDLREGRLDLICTAATITPERARTFDFSERYLDTALAVVVPEASPVRGVDDLEGRVVGARVATVAEEAARGRTRAARVVTFDLNTEAYRALAEGRVDAVVDDVAIGGHFARSLPGLRQTAAIPGTVSSYAFMLAKGNEALRKAVNAALRDLRVDGTSRRLVRRWLETDEGAAAHATATRPASPESFPSGRPVPLGSSGDDGARDGDPGRSSPLDRSEMRDETGEEDPPPVAVVRIWHGRTRAEHADTYLRYIEDTGLPGYRAIAGNLGVEILRRVTGGEAEFLVVSRWESMDAIRAFAGDDVEKAVYYPHDDEFLLEREPKVMHWQLAVSI